MRNRVRAYIFAFLSRIYAREIDMELLKDISENEELLATIGEDALAYIQNAETSLLLDELNIEYHTLFLINNHPIESSVQDVKNEILVGLQNPVVQFYLSHGYEINLEASSLHVPDHIAIEFGFMQKLVLQDDKESQLKFYREHLLTWIPQFLTAVKEAAENPFYKDICDFTIDFLLEDYCRIRVKMSKDV